MRGRGCTAARASRVTCQRSARSRLASCYSSRRDGTCQLPITTYQCRATGPPTLCVLHALCVTPTKEPDKAHGVAARLPDAVAPGVMAVAAGLSLGSLCRRYIAYSHTAISVSWLVMVPPETQ